MLSPQDLEQKLSKTVDQRLANLLIQEFTALEETFMLRRWKYSELDGGRFAEVAARIVYAADSGNLSLSRSVDACLKYVENNQVAHAFPEPQAATHLAKVIRSIYKLRSQRGAVHVSPTYTANEIDARFVIEAARWVLAELLRIFVTSDREALADVIRALAKFPQPLIRLYGDTPLLQSISFSIEEEVLAHLLFADGGLSSGQLISAMPRDPSGIRRALKKLAGPTFRQVVARRDRWAITDLGITRIEDKIATEDLVAR